MTKLPGSNHLENQACARAAGTGRGRTINHAAIRSSLKPRTERRTYCTSIDRKTSTLFRQREHIERVVTAHRLKVFHHTEQTRRARLGVASHHGDILLAVDRVSDRAG